MQGQSVCLMSHSTARVILGQAVQYYRLSICVCRTHGKVMAKFATHKAIEDLANKFFYEINAMKSQLIQNLLRCVDVFSIEFCY